MSKFAKFTLIKFVLPTDTSSEEFCTAYYFLHGSLEGKFSVVKSCNTILSPLFLHQIQRSGTDSFSAHHEDSKTVIDY